MVTNFRGDVESIYNMAGTELARYSYDAWGKVTSIRTPAGQEITDKEHIANVNPMRYRGYYQDAETGLYYLQSRYYDPVSHRFMNADGYVSTGKGFVGFNMFAYCNNNAVNMIDRVGTQSNWVLDGVSYSYDGSAADFHRSEHGKPPFAYSEALRKKNVKKQVYHTNQLRIDTDGAKGSYGSSSHQGGTSYQWATGKKIAADEIPFIVIPESFGTSLLGHMGVVIDNNTGNYIYAIVGDVGNADKGMGEVSLKAAWDLGYSKKEANGNCGPEGDFTIIIYVDEKFYPGSKVTHSDIQQAGKGLYR